jgi:hypothetical protein|tara:strand:+ start:3423 stop:3737 length:315 start_codon:yes stop_codon:yes gene_type:complete
MKKGIIISTYILLGAFLTAGIFSASWMHYRFGNSEFSSEIKRVEVDVFELPDYVEAQPNRVYFKKVNITTSIKAGSFPKVIIETVADTVMSKDGVVQIFSDEKQ